jgi:hypothetical protein
MNTIRQLSQQQQGAGGVIQQNAAVRTAVNDSSIYTALNATCRAHVDGITAKALGDWSESDYAYMVSMLTVARHC